MSDLDSRIADAARRLLAISDVAHGIASRYELEPPAIVAVSLRKQHADTMRELVALCREKPTRRRVVVWQRWEVRRTSVDGTPLHTNETDDRAQARRMARSYRRMEFVAAVRIVKVTRYRLEKCT